MNKAELDRMRDDPVQFSRVFLNADIPPWQDRALRAIIAKDCEFPRDWGRTRAVIAWETEFLQPLIKRTFELMRERGLIPPDPEAK